MKKQTYNCVLLIDDDKITNYINQRMVKKLHLSDHIQMTESVQEGLRFIEDYKNTHEGCSPDLIFLDVNMPGMKGFDFLKAYEQIPFTNKEEVKIIVISASSNDRDRDRIDQYNLPYLTKPLTMEKISELLGL